jgi:hypothetical protein
MSEARKISLNRLLVETTAIVLSILLAFAIDAWWEDRAARSEEQVLLKRLRADFTELQKDIRHIEQEHIKASSACLSLMNIAIGEALPASAEFDYMVAIVFITSWTFNPGSGAVAAFLGGEGARLITNQTLADRLLAWPGLVEELQEEDVSMQKAIAERWTPFLASRVSLGPYMATYGDLLAGIPEHVTDPISRTSLIVDQTFINHVLDRFKSQQIALRDIKPVVLAVDEILLLLENEISE